MPKSSIKRVPVAQIRQWFNDNVLSRENQFEVQIIKEKHPSNTRAGQPFCTRTQMLLYTRDGKEVARALQFLRSDGTIGASGSPDPKRIIVNRQVYCPQLEQ